jgi:hypothetical protein
MKPQGARKEKTPAMKNVQIIMPVDLHTLVKMKATKEQMTLRAYILKTLAASVKKD